MKALSFFSNAYISKLVHWHFSNNSINSNRKLRKSIDSLCTSYSIISRIYSLFTNQVFFISIDLLMDYKVIHDFDELKNRCPTILLSIIAQLFVIVINPILSILSYTYAAQSLLTPFAGLSIVWSLLFSSFLLPEIPDQSKYKSVFMITVYPFSQSYSYFPLF